MPRLLPILLLLAASVPSAQTAGPRLLVLNKEDATLVAVDPASGKILGKAPTGEGPHEVAASADGKLAVVANYGSQAPGHTLSVIDLATMKELKRVDVSPLWRPHGLFFKDDGVFFTSETNRILARYNPSADKIDWLFGTGQSGTHMVWVNPDATKMVACNIGGNSLSILERGANPANWNQTVVPVGQGPEGFDVSPDGKQIWAAHSRDGGVSIVDLDQKKVIQTFDVKTKRSNRLKFTPDGTKVLISDLDAGTVIVVDVPTRDVIKTIPVGPQVAGILMQPDGARAYVAATGGNFVAIVDLKTLAVTGRIEPGRGPDGMAWAR